MRWIILVETLAAYFYLTYQNVFNLIGNNNEFFTFNNLGSVGTENQREHYFPETVQIGLSRIKMQTGTNDVICTVTYRVNAIDTTKIFSFPVSAGTAQYEEDSIITVPLSEPFNVRLNDGGSAGILSFRSWISKVMIQKGM